MVEWAMVHRKASTAAGRNARNVRARVVEDLERLMADAGVSQLALSGASGVPQSYISRILLGAAKPSLETYARLGSALGADVSARLYPNTGPAIRDRHSVPILEALLGLLHPRWQPVTEVRVHRPARGWIDLVLKEPRANVIVAAEIESTLNRVEQLIRWSGEKADSLPWWDEWPSLADDPAISRLLLLKWTRSTRDAARTGERQVRLAFPAHPDDALAALKGTAPWPGPALIWARADHGEIRFVNGR